jgi:hypothetical protein
MTIVAILDLEKAIETYRNKIQTLLQWDDLSDWDGKAGARARDSAYCPGSSRAMHCPATERIEPTPPPNKRLINVPNHHEDLAVNPKGKSRYG